jgi:hypothetical protein
MMSERGSHNADAQDFVTWLRAEAEAARASAAGGFAAACG